MHSGVRLLLIIGVSFFGLTAHTAVSPGADTLKETITDWCDGLSKELVSVRVDHCKQRQWQVAGKSQTGRPIPYLFWGAPEGKRVLLLGAIHGDEISAVSLVFRWMEFLDKTRQESFLRKTRFLVFPLVNPDGFYAQPRTRTNQAGVDLNRNFGTKAWDSEAMPHWKSKAHRDPRRFPGKTGASESETRVVQKWIEEFKPDLIISVHAPYGLVDHDGPIQFPNDGRSPLPVKTLGAFPGSLGKYAGVERNIPVVTVELSAAKKVPDVKAIEDLLLFILKAKY